MFETDFTTRLVKDHIHELEQLRRSIETERMVKRQHHQTQTAYYHQPLAQTPLN